jgi:hypothetical protein
MHSFPCQRSGALIDENYKLGATEAAELKD